MAENITAHMDKSLESLKHNFSKVRTGRANANILSDITVDYYGVPTPVTQVAAVKTPEAHMLLIEPWDKALINAIVKAIGASDLGITPNSDGTVVRLPFPAPTAPCTIQFIWRGTLRERNPLLKPNKTAAG